MLRAPHVFRSSLALAVVLLAALFAGPLGAAEASPAAMVPARATFVLELYPWPR